jgi:hypothetical protein
MARSAVSDAEDKHVANIFQLVRAHEEDACA